MLQVFFFFGMKHEWAAVPAQRQAANLDKCEPMAIYVYAVCRFLSIFIGAG